MRLARSVKVGGYLTDAVFAGFAGAGEGDTPRYRFDTNVMLMRWIPRLSLLLGLVAIRVAASDFYATFPLPANVHAAALDSAGNLYLAGTTNTPNLQPTPGAFQSSFERAVCGTIYMGHVPVPVYCEHAFVARVDSSGTRLLSLTYITGSKQDSINGIAAAPDGSVWLAGATSSSDFPVTVGQAATAGFLAHMDANGKLLFSRSLPVVPAAVAVDGAGNVYAAGTNNDVVVLACNAAGEERWSQILSGSADDAPNALAVGPDGSVYVAGFTNSVETNPDVAIYFPMTGNSYHTRGGSTDIFVARLRPDGSGMVFSSVFGGAGLDSVQALLVDASGNALVAGSTFDMSTFPTTEGAFRPTGSGTGPFVVKLSADGTRLIFGTFISSGPEERIDRAQLDSQGRMLLSGGGTDFTFPVTPDALDPCYPDADPARFFFVLSNKGDRPDYSTFVHQRVLAIAPTGLLYQVGLASIIDLVNPFAAVPTGPRCLVSAASYRGHTVAPGEVISIFGTEIGPDPGVAGPGTSVAGTRLLVAGIAAPLLYVSSGQINAVAPFALQPGTTVKVEVERDGLKKASTVEAAVVATLPSLFAAGGAAAVINQDGTVNSAAHPAAQGSVVSIYGTGFGAMQPARSDGEVPSGAGSMVAAPTRMYVSGQEAEVLYSGDAPGLIAGVVQVNFRIPAVPDTGFLRVIAYVGDAYTDYRVATSLWVR